MPRKAHRGDAGKDGRKVKALGRDHSGRLLSQRTSSGTLQAVPPVGKLETRHIGAPDPKPSERFPCPCLCPKTASRASCVLRPSCRPP